MTRKTTENIKINDLEIPKELQNRRRILIAVDNSKHSAKALLFAKEQILRKEDFVMLLTATKKLIAPYLITFEAIKPIEDDELNKETFALYNQLEQIENEKMGFLVQGDDNRETLIEAIEELEPEMVIAGSHGKGTVKRMLLGSTSEYLLHHSKIPVTIVR
ncbi:hypothetical protein MHBO_004573 [Bonamia ostreae]|uniref:UspA domain-containing protein n=1 Tax=Bonamia ostreae TaxID=126728 RepID=A0ABV2AU97_9EUKA